MEKGRIYNEIPEIDPETRREIYNNYKNQISQALDMQPYVRASLIFQEYPDVGIIAGNVVASSGSIYQFTRNTNADITEITIDRYGKRMDNPNFLHESIRFRHARMALRPLDPDIEYSRILKKGGSVSISNNIVTIKRVDRFVGDLLNELSTTKS